MSAATTVSIVYWVGSLLIGCLGVPDVYPDPVATGVADSAMVAAVDSPSDADANAEDVGLVHEVVVPLAGPAPFVTLKALCLVIDYLLSVIRAPPVGLFNDRRRYFVLP